ncbi:hypothetical protein Bca101_010462 [Brassica carinata]
MSRTVVNKVLNANQIRTGAERKRSFASGMAMKTTVPGNATTASLTRKNTRLCGDWRVNPFVGTLGVGACFMSVQSRFVFSEPFHRIDGSS